MYYWHLMTKVTCMGLCVKWLDSRMDNGETGKLLLQEAGRTFLHVKLFKSLRNLHKKDGQLAVKNALHLSQQLYSFPN